MGERGRGIKEIAIPHPVRNGRHGYIKLTRGSYRMPWQALEIGSILIILKTVNSFRLQAAQAR